MIRNKYSAKESNIRIQITGERIHEYEHLSVKIIQSEAWRKRLKKINRELGICGQYKICNVLVIGVPCGEKREW